MHTRDDHQGLACSAASAQALQAFRQALQAFQRWQGDPVALIEPALREEPDFAMGHVLHAWLHALSLEPAAAALVAADISALQRLRLQEREAAHLQALQAFAGGQWLQAGQLLEDLSLQWPRDALALQAGHLVDYLRGDSRMLRDRIARALPAWPQRAQDSHAVLGMWAFGLQECGQLDQALQAGVQALALQPADAWAHHAVAHVHETRGQAAAGAQWMRSRRAHWDGGHFLSIHNAWHWALFELEQGDARAALRLYDEALRAGRSGLLVDLVDASAMLWRLELAGLDVASRWQALAEDWAAHARPGANVFNDLHAMLAWLGSGQVDRARCWLAAQAEGDVATEQGGITRALGTPLLQALLLRHEGRYREAAQQLRALRPQWQRIGGSHAQRDLLELLLLDSALRCGESAPRLGAGLLQERLLLRPQGWLNQLLAQRMAADGSGQQREAGRAGPAQAWMKPPLPPRPARPSAA